MHACALSNFIRAAAWAGALALAPMHAALAYPSYSPSNCSGCHGNPSLGSTPASGQILSFGSNGFTLVGQSTIGTLVLRNNRSTSDTSVGTRGGGFSGSFPNVVAGSGFSTSGLLTVVGDNGYLTPQLSDSHSYVYAPTTRGPNSQTISFTPTNGFANGQVPTVSVTLQGQGVAPVISLVGSQTDAGNVRLGTSGTASISVSNIGDGNLSGLGAISNLQGNVSVAASPFFGGPTNFNLSDGASAQFDFNFAPTVRGPDASGVVVSASNGHTNGSNLAQSLQLQLHGNGVGPQYATSMATNSEIDFGNVSTQALRTLSITNATPDPDLGALTGLTLLSYQISGPDASFFSLSGFTPGTLLAAGNNIDLGLVFSAGATPGMRAATLRLSTDENAALGQSGTEFSYTLAATSVTPVPEPHTVAMLLAGLCMVGVKLRNRRQG